MPKTIESPVKCGLRAVIRFLYSEKARGMLSSGIVVHDSARLHTAVATKRLLKHFRLELFDHPPSSAPDLAHCDLHLFSRMKRSCEDNILAQQAADQTRELTESTGGCLL